MKVIIDPGKQPRLFTADAAQEVKIELDNGDGEGAAVLVSEYRGRLLITVALGEASADQRWPSGILIVDVAPEPYKGNPSGTRLDDAEEAATG
jgi:hypothetical protein